MTKQAVFAAVAAVAALVATNAAAAAPDGPPTFTDAEVRTSAITLCTKEWPDDLGLRGACRRIAEDGARSFREIAARYANVPDMRRSLAKCMVEWTKDGVTDFGLLGACARIHEDGLKEMLR